jgi:predicted Fe-Mo cluster-binding NifX family protein
MKVCITSTGKGLDASIDPRFGRCQYLLLISIDTMDVEVMPNESAMASGGAGIKAAQMVANAKASLVITGNIGPNAFQALNAAGIKVITNASGLVKDAIDNYKMGRFQETAAPTVESHSGMDDKQTRGGGRNL